MIVRTRIVQAHRCSSTVGARSRKCSAGKWPLSRALSFPALLHLVSFTCSLHWKNEDVVGTVLQEQGSAFRCVWHGGDAGQRPSCQGCSGTRGPSGSLVSARAGPCLCPVLTVCWCLATCPLPQSNRVSPRCDSLYHLQLVVELLQALREAPVPASFTQGEDGLQEFHLGILLAGLLDTSG